MSEAPQGIDESARIVRALPAKGVTVYRPMVFSGELVHSLDYVVLLHTLFAIADGSEITVPGIWKQLQEKGIRSSKKEDVLVGRDAVYKSFARIIEAGYILRTRLPHPDGGGRLGPVTYVAYEDPEDNEAWKVQRVAAALGATESPQVGPLPGYREVETRPIGHSDVLAGGTTSRVAGSGVATSGYPGSGERHIPAGQTASRVSGSGGLSPLQPPVVGTTPPIPPVAPVPSVSADAGTGRGRGNRSANKTNPAQVTPELKAAVAFLMELPKPFACGLRHARRFAPKLLTAMAFLGWEEPDEYLAMELVAKSADGLADPPAAIGVRIEDLRPRHIVVRDRAKPAPQTPPQAPCPTHPGLEAAGCPQCAAADAMDRQRRELDAAKGIDDESARKALEAMLANRGPQSRAARGREHAARQGAQAREEASKRDAYLRELEALSG